MYAAGDPTNPTMKDALQRRRVGNGVLVHCPHTPQGLGPDFLCSETPNSDHGWLNSTPDSLRGPERAQESR